MIDLAAAKAWLRVETTAEDAVIGGLVASAVGTIEAQTGKFMSPKQFVRHLSAFPCRYPYSVNFTVGPVTEITSVIYQPADGSAQATLSDFRLVEGYGRAFNGSLQPVYGQAFPVTIDGDAVVTIAGTAGYVDGEAPELDQAALMLVAHWYANREGVVTGAGVASVELPWAVQQMISPYRPAGLA